MRSILSAALVTFILAATGDALRAGTGIQGPQTSPALEAKPSPREAGVRYGQAIGAARACYGLRTTQAAAELGRTYQGADDALFRDEARRVIASWENALSCVKAGGPNECRLIFEHSCRDAYREIGPEGSSFPGLVERND
jgi:hypothetical protein